MNENTLLNGWVSDSGRMRTWFSSEQMILLFGGLSNITQSGFICAFFPFNLYVSCDISNLGIKKLNQIYNDFLNHMLVVISSFEVCCFFKARGF